MHVVKVVGHIDVSGLVYRIMRRY